MTHLPTHPRDWLADFPPARSLPLDQEALRVYEQAYYLGLETEDTTEPPITFSTVALALITGQDECSRWFAQRAADNGPRPDAICAEKNTSMERISALVNGVVHPTGKPDRLRLSTDSQLLTASARAVLETAEEWASRVGGSDIGVRHLVASYVLNPPAAHRKQMNDWGFTEMPWRTEFYAWIAGRYTAEAWTDASLKVAPTKALASFESPKVKGEALAFPGDSTTMDVLGRAAEYHARRADTWLRLQTVFFALVEQARADAGLRSAIAPIWNAVEPIEDKYQAAFSSYLTNPRAPRDLIAFDALDISPRVLNGLETARELALTTRHKDGTVGVLQLAGALISRRVDGDEDMAAAGFDPSALRLTLIEHAVVQGESSEVWREALGEYESAPARRPVDLNSDEPEAVVRSDEKWKDDPLGIRPDVASFAALLASKSLQPPLAIGLFGPWGSGKTTFLKRLRLTIDEQASQARAARDVSPPTPFVSNVVHVEFNAWHFAEDALISSLIDTIVRELRSYLRNDYPPVGEALAKLKSETAETSRRRLELARQKEADARTKVATARTAVSTNEETARKEAASLQGVVRAAWLAAAATVKNSSAVKESGVLEHLDGTIENFDELRTRLDAIRSRPARMLTQLGWMRTLLFAGTVLVLPPVVAWLVDNTLGTESVGQALTSLGALLSVVAIWLRAASGAVAKVDRAIAEVTRAFEMAIRDDPKVKAAEEKLASANAEAAGAAKELATAESELRQAEADAAAASLPGQMKTLVSGRVDDMTYAKELTTISVARGDLQKLSQILRDQVATTPAAPPGVRPVDRVILYIDDLDRCSPNDVVRVLQVVHMLLAFELFVVVVAVDARWVEESLRRNYEWLGSTDLAGTGADKKKAGVADKESARVTPQDYLEKIFQISFWLEPMTSARAAEYLKSLVRTPRGIAAPAAGGRARPEEIGPGGTGRVEILPIELDYMRALAGYVGPSPRRVKRLVNAYRLLKARLSDAQLQGFLTDRRTDKGVLRSGPYQLVIGLLVIGTGAPASAAQMLQELAERDPRDTFEQVIESFRQRGEADWTMATQVLETLLRTQKASDVSELRGWARRVGRFLLQGPTEVLRQRSLMA